ncbi:MAG: type II toxin-antitoxin system HicB family antitoxin [Desulfobacterales bacterium]|nr:type II toxin-antitoxin system HicB family antitoxin [Desulfobacterales bacterium]
MVLETGSFNLREMQKKYLAGVMDMISAYIERAMSKAIYEKLEDGSYWGEIPQCPGTNACKPTLRECQEELRSVLEDWILLSFQDGDELPVIDGIDLNKRALDERKIASL